jgi:integrase/recombinase XerD
MSLLAPTLQAFFTDRLMTQRHASPHTVAAYRDTMRLLLAFAQQRTGRAPSKLKVDDLDAGLIAAFLDYLERGRGNSARTRNARLAAIHSLFSFAALRHPEHGGSIERVLAIPPKRFDRKLVTFLSEPEVKALLAACDRSRWAGRRDHALLLLAVQTGLRASELIGLRLGDIHLGHGPHVSCHGKGRKERATPLTKGTVSTLRTWLAERGGEPGDPLFPARHDGHLSRDALERRLARYVEIAATTCPSLASKAVTLHVLRHTTAMRLLHGNVDTSVIALWLGHESPETTQIYLHADMALKERALDKTTPLTAKPGRYRATDAVLAFLQGL